MSYAAYVPTSPARRKLDGAGRHGNQATYKLRAIERIAAVTTFGAHSIGHSRVRQYVGGMEILVLRLGPLWPATLRDSNPSNMCRAESLS